MAMSPELETLLKGVLETQEQIGQTLLKMNEAPNVATPAPAKGVDDGQGTPAPATRRYITPMERLELSETLRTKSDAHLHQLFSMQAREKNQGVPLDLWLNTAGFAAQNAFANIQGELAARRGQGTRHGRRRRPDPSGSRAGPVRDLRPRVPGL